MLLRIRETLLIASSIEIVLKFVFGHLEYLFFGRDIKRLTVTSNMLIL